MPYRIDLFAVFIFLGIVQAIFLSFFFFSKDNRKIPANFFHGIMLVGIAACSLEIFLMYTGYIIHCFYLVDFSEPVAFIIGPAFYLMLIGLINGSVSRKQYLHFITPVIYLLLLMPFFLRGEDTKYNAWIYSYHPELPYRAVTVDDGRYFWVTHHATELILISLGVYGLLGLYQVVIAFRKKNESLVKTSNPVLRKLRFGVIEVIGISLLVLVVKMFNLHDTGDHLFAALISVIIYVTSFTVMRQSGFFRQAALTEPQKKYKNVVHADVHESTLIKLKQVMETEKLFCKSDFSLPDLAQRLGVSVHVLSQVINDGLGKSFFEMTAEYRVQEARQLLIDQPNIKVEEIAEQVGYSSKSSFNTAFKKITGQTPSAYRANP